MDEHRTQPQTIPLLATVGPTEHGRFADLEEIKSEDASAIQVPIDANDLADEVSRT